MHAWLLVGKKLAPVLRSEKLSVNEINIRFFFLHHGVYVMHMTIDYPSLVKNSSRCILILVAGPPKTIRLNTAFPHSLTVCRFYIRHTLRLFK
jgi:hypothetical protein